MEVERQHSGAFSNVHIGIPKRRRRHVSCFALSSVIEFLPLYRYSRFMLLERGFSIGDGFASYFTWPEIELQVADVPIQSWVMIVDRRRWSRSKHTAGVSERLSCVFMWFRSTAPVLCTFVCFIAPVLSAHVIRSTAPVRFIVFHDAK